MTHNLLYTCANTIQSRTWLFKMTYVESTLHKFLQQYAWEYAKVKIPYPEDEAFLLGQHQTQKIGKTMLTHQKTPGWEPVHPYTLENQATSNAIRKDTLTRVDTQEINIDHVWHMMKDVFLYGGALEILGIRHPAKDKWLGLTELERRNHHLFKKHTNYQSDRIEILDEAELEAIRKIARQSFHKEPTTKD